ncbi:hypothetical protein HPB52_000879 [Rhipicephalus sanguineus]|uniref:Cux N-terminal domain-containing protein n=1 Tax=Rhipicephalus sanguineus TaxID=34632 RepID=A0A9D4PT95_RHISA|nr:hypothetical protein HPB52_000879 [Rhipicephalus sanguineus]
MARYEPGYGRKPKGRSDVRCLVSPLLRHFQTEVDRLGERSLAAEAAFLALYKRVLRAVSVAHSENYDEAADPPSPVADNRLGRRFAGRLRKWTPD